MRWVVVLLLAGCVMPAADEPLQHRTFLLGDDACAEGVCRVAGGGPLRPLVAVDAYVEAVVQAGPWTLWAEADRLMAYRDDTKELVTVWTSAARLGLHAVGDEAWVTVQTTDEGGTMLWRWDAEQQAVTRQRAAMDGAFDVLDATDDRLLLAQRTATGHLPVMVLQDRQGQPILRFDGGNVTGDALGTIGEDFVVFGFREPGEPTRLWVRNDDVVAGLWTANHHVRDVHALGAFAVLAGKEVFEAIDVARGVRQWTHEGHLLGIDNGTAFYLMPDDFGWSSLWTWDGGAPRELAALSGKAVMASHVGERQVTLAVSGAERMLVTIAV